MNPVDHLLEEHAQFRRQMADLSRALAGLESGGEAAWSAALPVFREFGEMMAGALARHAAKEDDLLFPALEEAFGAQFPPAEVMRGEHRQIHAQGALLRATLTELAEQDHPAIVARGEALRRLAGGDGRDREAIRTTAAEVLELMESHFTKEEQILFPMAVQLLDEAGLAAVAARMEAVA